MPKTQHTPGPYMAFLGYDGRHNVIPILTKAPEFDRESMPYHPLIAHVLMGRGHADRATAEATATLFASAPDMLAALKVALRTMEGVDGENDCSKAIASVEAAIAKAEGLA